MQPDDGSGEGCWPAATGLAGSAAVQLASALRLREVIRGLRSLGTRTGTWAADAFEAYLAGAAEGLTLEQAFGLGTRPDEELTFWSAAGGVRLRQQLVEQLAECFAGSANRRSEAAAEAARRYASGRWAAERHRPTHPPDASRLDAILFQLQRNAELTEAKWPLSARWLRESWNRGALSIPSFLDQP